MTANVTHPSTHAIAIDTGKICSAPRLYRGLRALPRILAACLLIVAGSAWATCYPEFETITPLGGDDANINGIMRQSDGKYIVASTVRQHDVLSGILLRYNSDGSIDATFGSDGRAAAFAGGASTAWALIPMIDGRFLVAGSAAGRLTLSRHAVDGSLDTSFGTNGIASAPAPANEAQAFALQSDGKVVAVGTASTGPNGFYSLDIAIARFNGDGSVDTSFGSGGVVVTNFGADRYDEAHDVAIQADGKIVLTVFSAAAGQGSQFMVMRLNSDGTLDSTFGADGVATAFATNPSSAAYRVVVQPDGKIVAGGRTAPGGYSSFAALARFNPDGSLDTSFGVNGEVMTGINNSSAFELPGVPGNPSFALLLQSDGELDVVASDNTQTGFTYNTFATARFKSDGSQDPIFGAHGSSGDAVLRTELGTGSSDASAALLEPDGRLVVAGYVYPHYPGQGHAQAGVVRYPQLPDQCNDVRLQPVNPVTFTVPRSGSVTKTIRMKIENVDLHPYANALEPVHLIMVVGQTCSHIAVSTDSPLPPTGVNVIWSDALAVGKKKTVKVKVTVHNGDVSNLNHKTPTRCLLVLEAASEYFLDTNPSNNVQAFPIDLIDRSLPDQVVPHESFLEQVNPVEVTLPVGTTSIAKQITVKVGNGDIGETAGHTVTVVPYDGDCPSGTVQGFDFDSATPGAQNTRTVPGGATVRGKLSLLIDGTAFDTALGDTTNKLSPLHCTAGLAVNGPGGDTDATNDSIPIAIDLFNKNDF